MLISIRLDTEEHQKIKQNAEKVGLTIRQYIIYTALNTEIKIQLKPREINIEKFKETL